MNVMHSVSNAVVTIELPEIEACLLRDIVVAARNQSKLTHGEKKLTHVLETFLVSAVGTSYNVRLP